MTHKLPCYHVTTTDGSVYGVAAHGVREAKQMTQDRLTRDEDASRPATAVRVGTWDADYGTVLCYTGPTS